LLLVGQVFFDSAILFYLFNYILLFIHLIIYGQIIYINWGLGIGDWGLGIGDWGLGPIPNPQSPIPNPQSPIYF
jgi:hypothetical protein